MSRDKSGMRTVCHRRLGRNRSAVARTARLLSALDKRKCGLCVNAGNMNGAREGELTSSGLRNCFRSVFVSRRVKRRGPGTLFFRRVLSALGTDRGRRFLVVKSHLSSSVGNTLGVKVSYI